MATFEYKKRNLLKRTCILILIFFSISINLIAREEAISLYPELLPDDSMLNEITSYARNPIEEFDKERASQLITETKEIINQLEKAAQCSKCNWTYLELEQKMFELRNYRCFAHILAFKSRVHIAKGEYTESIKAIRSNLQLAQHLRKNNEVIYGLVSIAISALSLQQIEDLIQRPDSPNLYYALEDLPKPLISIKELTKYIQLAVKKRVENLSKRLERDKAALQCLEALRLYADEHDGIFPNRLDDIKTVEIPVNAFTGKPFSYEFKKNTAVLKAEVPEEIEDEEPLIYNITFKKDK
ncbi:MAG: hypothetical protein ACYSUL_05700 [Planctomycetota bacterium]|jgi:hypothetical protein